MTLATHAVIGAAFAQLFPDHPAVAFFVGFVSHFGADALPHWDYQLVSAKRNLHDSLIKDMPLGFTWRTFFDLSRVAIDFYFGIILSLLIFTPSASSAVWATLAGALGGLAPDPLQFAYWKLKREPLTSLQKLHRLVHTSVRMRNKPILGIVLQVIVVVFVVALLQLLTSV